MLVIGKPSGPGWELGNPPRGSGSVAGEVLPQEECLLPHGLLGLCAGVPLTPDRAKERDYRDELFALGPSANTTRKCRAMNKEEAPDRTNRGFVMRQSEFGGDGGSVRGGCRTCGQNAKSRIQVPRHGRDAAPLWQEKPRNSFPPSEAPPCASTHARIVSTKAGLALRPKKGTFAALVLFGCQHASGKTICRLEKERQPCCTGP